MTSYQTELYRKNLIDLTNSCGLTIGCAYYVAKDFLRELEMIYQKDLQTPPEPPKTVVQEINPFEMIEVKEEPIQEE